MLLLNGLAGVASGAILGQGDLAGLVIALVEPPPTRGTCGVLLEPQAEATAVETMAT